ncbi:MAG: hypothetical protein ACE369_02315 [Roseovarius sp.]
MLATVPEKAWLTFRYPATLRPRDLTNLGSVLDLGVLTAHHPELIELHGNAVEEAHERVGQGCGRRKVLQEIAIFLARLGDLLDFHHFDTTPPAPCGGKELPLPETNRTRIHSPFSIVAELLNGALTASKMRQKYGVKRVFYFPESPRWKQFHRVDATYA